MPQINNTAINIIVWCSAYNRLNWMLLHAIEQAADYDENGNSQLGVMP
jgi:hypothetical protein